VSFPHDRVIFIDIHEFKNNRTYWFYPIGLRLISTNLILWTLYLQYLHIFKTVVFTSSCCRVAHVLFTLFVFVCVHVYWCPTHIVLCFLFYLSSSCVHYVASFSGMSILIVPLIFSNVYLQRNFAIIVHVLKITHHYKTWFFSQFLHILNSYIREYSWAYMHMVVQYSVTLP
jgi:hypothetical protein